MSIEKYIIAVKRDKRGSESADWKEQVSSTSGIKVLSSGSKERLQVSASEEAVSRIASKLGHLLNIEKQIIHHT